MPSSDKVLYMSNDPYRDGNAMDEKEKVVSAPANVGATERAKLAPVTTKPFMVPLSDIGTVLLSANARDAK